MAHSEVLQFGPFTLDQPARALRLHQREVDLQPRVFDLLAYLIHSRTRVVPKDELLDAVWPGVTVTDNSLQRAISILRSALRTGGMEDAVRNIPRSGYRFCMELDTPGLPPAPQAVTQTATGDVDAARQAFAEQRWQDAAKYFEQADKQSSLAGGDLDSWAVALYCGGEPLEAASIVVRAIAEHTEGQNPERAASSAVFLSAIRLERNEVAIAKGWLARASELIADQPDGPAKGHIGWNEARLLAHEGNPLHALDRANEALEYGRKHGYADVEALSLVYRGFFRLSLGDTESGLADQDHAAALALSNKTDPITNGIIYCNILWACRTFWDWARANEWSLGYKHLCVGNGLRFSGSCQLHRAEVLAVQGSLPDAIEHIQDALAKLAGDAPWALGDAHRVLGDIESAIGNVDAARTAYEKSYALGWNPEPGYALLLLESGDAEAAFASLERSLIGQNWWTMQRQGMLLAHLAVVAAHAGRQEKAKAIIADLAAQEIRWPTPAIRALVSEASGVLVQKLDPQAALNHFHLARQLWTSVDSSYHATRLRLVLAELQLSIGDHVGAATELRTAIAAAEEQKSDKLVAKASKLLSQIPSGASSRKKSRN